MPAAGLSANPTLLRERLGPVGVWMSAIAGLSAADSVAAAAAIEALGYRSWWGGEGPRSRDIFANAAVLLAGTSKLNVVSAVANIYARDATAAKSGALFPGDAYPARFVLALGASHGSLVRSRGHDYSRPLTAVGRYLDSLDEVDYAPPPPRQSVPVLLAALGPKMLATAAQRTAGAHSYLVPVAHTASARAILGPTAFLAPELMVVMEEDPVPARIRARGALAPYLAHFPNYADNLRRLGYSEADLEDGGSDRLVDDLVAWGDAAAIRTRVDEHLGSGADHVCVQPLADDVPSMLDDLERLAPALLGPSVPSRGGPPPRA